MSEYFQDLHNRTKESPSYEKEEVLSFLSALATSEGRKPLPGEIEKNEEQIGMISYANRLVNDYAHQYGGKDFYFPVENIHIFNERVEHKNDNGGRTIFTGSADSNKPLIRINGTKGQLEFFHILVHEMIHVRSYHAVENLTKSFNLEYRNGLNLHSHKRKMKSFRVFDEAVTELLTTSILNKAIDSHPDIFARDRDLLQSLGYDLDLVSKGKVGYFFEEKDGALLVLNGQSYKKERKIFSDFKKKFIQKLMKQLSITVDEADTKIKDLFLEAKFGGKLVPLGTAIDRAFGKGTFMSLAKVSEGVDWDTDFEATEEIKKMEMLVESL